MLFLCSWARRKIYFITDRKQRCNIVESDSSKRVLLTLVVEANREVSFIFRWWGFRLAEGSEFGRNLHNPRRNEFDSLLCFRIGYLPTHVYLHFRHLRVKHPTVWQMLPVESVKTLCMWQIQTDTEWRESLQFQVYIARISYFCNKNILGKKRKKKRTMKEHRYFVTLTL